MLLRKLGANPVPGWPSMSKSASPSVQTRFATFADFYTYYLQEHRNLACLRLHFVGTALVITLVFIALGTGNLRLLMFIPFAGYGFAWLGHFMFEKNRPATFSHPWYSLAADFVLFRDILAGRIRI
jgi:hypothetical protein